MRIKKPGNPKAKCSYKNGKIYQRKEKYKNKVYSDMKILNQ